MKCIPFLIWILIALTHSIKAQDFGAIGTSWYYDEHGTGLVPPSSEYLHIQSVSDTVIDGKIAHKLVQSYYRYNGDTVHPVPHYVHQDADTLFLYSFSDSRFLKLLIFNAEPGDTLTLDVTPPTWDEDTVYQMRIEAVEQVLVDGVALKKYSSVGLPPNPDYGYAQFMDRIGRLDWFTPRGTIILEAGGPLRCYSDAELDTNFLSMACDHRLIVAVNDLENDLLSIYPNPTSDRWSVRSDKAMERIDLYDAFGRLLQSTEVQEVDVTGLATGTYVLHIVFRSGHSVRRKVASW